MANVGFRFESRPTFRDIQGRFVSANRRLLEERRDEVRGLGRLAVQHFREEAPKKSGRFAQGIGFRSFVQGDAVGFTVHMPQPLGNYIVRGTRPHAIVGNPYLSFFWERAGRHVVVRSVNHPGTKPNPFPDRALERWEPSAAAAIRRISTRWIARVTG